MLYNDNLIRIFHSYIMLSNKNYKILVLDLDGTLTNKKKEITSKTKEMLKLAMQKGVIVVLASGRPTYGIVPLAEEIELAKFGGYILSFNGDRKSVV